MSEFPEGMTVCIEDDCEQFSHRQDDWRCYNCRKEHAEDGEYVWNPYEEMKQQRISLEDDYL
jgi:hypothetical protein